MMKLDPESVASINQEHMYIYTTVGTFILQNRSEFNSLVLQVKNHISKRPNILDRFEYWELTGNDLKELRRILLGRSRNDSERKLVEQFYKFAQSLETNGIETSSLPKGETK
jgi:hypothetical protein